MASIIVQRETQSLFLTLLQAQEAQPQICLPLASPLRLLLASSCLPYILEKRRRKRISWKWANLVLGEVGVEVDGEDELVPGHHGIDEEGLTPDYRAIGRRVGGGGAMQDLALFSLLLRRHRHHHTRVDCGTKGRVKGDRKRKIIEEGSYLLVAGCRR